MKVTIAAIGKESRSSPAHHLYEEYVKRLPWTIQLREFEVKQNLPDLKLKEKESQLLLEAIDAHSKVIALDERGKNLSSEEFAQLLGKWQEQGDSKVAFLIGGAPGHSDAVRQRADLLLSFGKLTWPHKMVRPMLAEQLYRAYTILTGHPYHRS